MSLVIAALGLALLAAFAVLRRRSTTRAADSPPKPHAAVALPRADADPSHTPAALSARLFGLAFAVPAVPAPLAPDELQLREGIVRGLHAESSWQRFPRRPALMPQLLRAMDDPLVAADQLSRIVAHDPVLAAEVLEVANSGLYRAAGVAAVETIARAIVVIGADALRGVLARAMLQPVFRASRTNFPRFPRMLWERTERAARAAELIALKINAAERFEAQLLVLLQALGPLVVYGATLEAYARQPHRAPNGALCLELVMRQGADMARAVARRWEVSARLIAALEGAPGEPLSAILAAGELLGTLAQLHSQQMIGAPEAAQVARAAGIADDVIENLLAKDMA